MDNSRQKLVPRIMGLYHNSRKGNANLIAEHSYAKNIIDGILVIHLLEKNRQYLTYDFGSIEDGLEEVKNLLAS